jgi:pimeloyl-ACP methyl ester carboxylesterase
MPEDFVSSQIPESAVSARTKPKPWWACPRCWMKTVQVILLVVLAAGAVFYMRPMWVIQHAIALHLWSQGVRSEYVNAGGYRLHYLVVGEGEPVLLVHGLGAKAEDWGNLLPAIARGGYKVYAIDLLGYGKSDKPAEASYSIAQEAGIVRAFLDAKGLERVDLGGWSMGGWVSLKVASDAPERVNRLMLFDSAGIRFDIKFPHSIFWPGTPAELAELTSWLLPQPPPYPDFLARDMLRTFRPRQWVIRRSVSAMETEADVMDGKLGSLKMPVLIVWGAQDRLTPVYTAEVMHKEIPQSELVLFDGCGHLAPVQCESKIAPRVLEFLRTQPNAAATTPQIPAGLPSR